METEITVRGYHTDSYQHVNNARYLEFLEENRWQAIEKYIGMDFFTKNQLLIFVININISYKAQTRVHDQIKVSFGLAKIDKVKAVIKQQIINTETGKLCVEADVTFVVANSHDKPMRMKGELRQALEQLPRLQG